MLKKYERICFEKDKVGIHGKPMADLVHPAHPLMNTTTDLVLSAHRAELKQGAILVDPNDDGIKPRILFMIDHEVREGSADNPRTVSRRLQFVAIDQHGNTTFAGWAPHLDLRPINEPDKALIEDVLDSAWVKHNLEGLALHYASQKLVPEHYQEVKSRRERQADKILAAVNDRLVKEISYWSDRYIKLSEEIKAGKQPRMQPEMARRRVDELTERLAQRKRELEAMKNVVSSTPVVIGGALVIPQGLLASRKGEATFTADAEVRSRIEQIAMQAVMEVERSFGHEVWDVSAEKCGWDITARPQPNPDGSIKPDRHIEVKGRAKGQTTITVSRNEILYALNQADKFILAVVIVDGDGYEGPYYIKQPFNQEPDWAEASKNLV